MESPFLFARRATWPSTRLFDLNRGPGDVILTASLFDDRRTAAMMN
jgi:hypothetical protein